MLSTASWVELAYYLVTFSKRIAVIILHRRVPNVAVRHPPHHVPWLTVDQPLFHQEFAGNFIGFTAVSRHLIVQPLHRRIGEQRGKAV